MSDLCGIIAVNKPKDFTSFDVIAKMRGILKMKRLGHSGTLDPMATGVLLVFVGNATKACDILPNNEKSYTADFKLGITTNSQDCTGQILCEREFAGTKQDILDLLPTFLGLTKQLPPMFSAVSVGGKRLYDLARKGIEVERESRDIFIDKIELLSYDEKEKSGKVFISCQKGTYIRTIIHDLGEKLGCGGIMTGLVRNSSSNISLEKCYSLEQIQSFADKNTLADIIIPTEELFSDYSDVVLDEKQTKLYQNGVKLDVNLVNVCQKEQIHRVYSFEGKFLGLGQVKKETQEFAVYKNL